MHQCALCNPKYGTIFSYFYFPYLWLTSGGRTYLVGEWVILVGDQQDGEKKRQISTPVSAFSAIVGVSFLYILRI
jgi:hypothetical protein